MTFCVGIRVGQGLLALADTEIVRGDERLNKSKLAVYQNADGTYWWIMTSGLRSIRDKALIYLDEQSAPESSRFVRVYEVANAFGNQLRRVRAEDGAFLGQGGLTFNLHAIVGGKLQNDTEPSMYYVYPEGNWIESNQDSPYFAIGRTYYAKPMLDRLLSSDLDIRRALAVAFLAFDATRSSVSDVGYPIDVMASDSFTGQIVRSRLDASDLQSAADWWKQTLINSLNDFPTDCFRKVFGSFQ